MLKGKSKIQLFESGKLVQEQENSNMITSAISSLLNPDMDIVGGMQINWCSLYGRITPLYSTGLGGILLWDEAITENANTVFPPAGCCEIGHAGEAYSGNNIYRGSYNVNESGTIANGYRHVWDFGTDRANGTIKSLSLTSRSGGNCGWENDRNDLQSFSYSVGYTSGASDISGFLANPAKNQYISLTVSSKTVTLKYFSLFNSTKVGLFDISSPVPVLTDTKTITTTGNVCGMNNWFVDNVYVAYSFIRASATTVYKVAINLLTGEKLIDETITVSGLPTGYTLLSTSNNNGFIYGGKMYLQITSSTADCRLAEFSLTGAYIKTFDEVMSSNYYMCQFSILGEKVIARQYSSSAYSYAIDLTRGKVSHIGDYSSFVNVCPSYLNRKGYVLGSKNASGVYIYLAIINPYLASINNLASPVVKTEAQTMKITYEITEAVD